MTGGTRKQSRFPGARKWVDPSALGERDAHLSRRRLPHGVALRAGVVQSQKIVGGGVAGVGAWRAPPPVRSPGGSPAEAGFDPSHPSRQQNQEEGFGQSRPTFHRDPGDAHLSRRRLPHGVALRAGVVQSQKIVGGGSVFGENSTAPSVLRTLIAAGEDASPDFSRPVAAQAFQALDAQLRACSGEGRTRRFTEVVCNEQSLPGAGSAGSGDPSPQRRSDADKTQGRAKLRRAMVDWLGGSLVLG